MNSVKPISQDGTSTHCQCSWDPSHSEGVACVDLVVWPRRGMYLLDRQAILGQSNSYGRSPGHGEAFMARHAVCYAIGWACTSKISVQRRFLHFRLPHSFLDMPVASIRLARSHKVFKSADPCQPCLDPKLHPGQRTVHHRALASCPALSHSIERAADDSHSFCLCANSHA